MMRAAVLAVAGAAAVCAAAVPAIVGMMGNTSFSHHIPVRVPVGASAPQLATDDRGATTPTRTESKLPGVSTSGESGDHSIEDSHGPTRHAHSSEPSEHGTPGTDDRRQHDGRGHDDGGSPSRSGSTSTGRGSDGRGPDDRATRGGSEGPGPSGGSDGSSGSGGSGSGGSGSGGSGSLGQHGDDHSGHGHG